jgi:rare lipoprotein A
MFMSIKKAWFIRGAILLLIVALSACAPYHARRKSVQYEATGVASWYGPGFAGRKTANGERYKPSGITAAHKTLPFGTHVRVTNLENDKSIVVRINDRGPFVKGRIIDLSNGAAKKIGVVATGTARVKVVALYVKVPKDGAEEFAEIEKVEKELAHNNADEY